MINGRRFAVTVTLAVAVIAACGTPAFADIGGGGTRGEADGTTLSATATKVTITRSGGGSGGNTRLAPTNSNWTPPVCWYEPVATPKQLKAAVEKIDPYNGSIPVTPSVSWGRVNFERFMEKKSEYNKYGDYAVSQEGKGKWYRGVINPNRKDEVEWDSCQEIMFFALNGEKPKAETLTPEILAGYAYDEIRVPDTKVTMNPSGKQTVNLPTWIWLDKAKFTPVTVKASLGKDLWAETTAKPKSLHIEPGTKDAEVFPASGDCPISEDGSIGTPYTEGKGKQDPPCGVNYLRSTTGGGSFQLKATLTWEISWKGSGGTGDRLPDGTFGTTTTVTVGEVQTINR
ncbi:hypothetical protein [Streptomyces sp. XD-27]|uniref:hypothetical protein n=1 Tax=Streptomyces sp. XD-27 TaxID=3062779 RepID=UPI0026F43282|nr:hypothetical protein [Streptomyces sp. XD-27]WKX70950.1 hypothetical protein Q3Y56_14475 [Streptomyces sp. XD-27]